MPMFPTTVRGTHTVHTVTHGDHVIRAAVIAAVHTRSRTITSTTKIYTAHLPPVQNATDGPRLFVLAKARAFKLQSDW